MRKTIGVLIGVSLLFLVGHAGAQDEPDSRFGRFLGDNGTGDPVGLISDAAIQPFWNNGADNTLIEVTSPRDWNDLYIVYYDQDCNRLFSSDKFISWKGAIVFTPDLLASDVQGLAVIATTKDKIFARPLDAAIHVRGYWFNLGLDFIRVVDPIAVTSTESKFPQQTYSPLRSAASFAAPDDDNPLFSTFLFLNCPSSNVLGDLSTFKFPKAPRTAFKLTRPGLILGYLYDDDENFLIDFDLPCSCSSMFEVGVDISPLYNTTDTYTELVTYNIVDEPFKLSWCKIRKEAEASLIGPIPLFADDVCDPYTFTGYRAIAVTAAEFPDGGADDFGRLNNGSAYNYRVNGNDAFAFGPYFTPGLR